jgi:hypothetical protein
LCFSSSVAVVMVKWARHLVFMGVRHEFLFENHVEYLDHGVQYQIELHCREAVYHMGFVME